MDRNGPTGTGVCHAAAVRQRCCTVVGDQFRPAGIIRSDRKPRFAIASNRSCIDGVRATRMPNCRPIAHGLHRRPTQADARRGLRSGVVVVAATRQPSLDVAATVANVRGRAAAAPRTPRSSAIRHDAAVVRQVAECPARLGAARGDQCVRERSGPPRGGVRCPAPAPSGPAGSSTSTPSSPATYCVCATLQRGLQHYAGVVAHRRRESRRPAEYVDWHAAGDRAPAACRSARCQWRREMTGPRPSARRVLSKEARDGVSAFAVRVAPSCVPAPLAREEIERSFKAGVEHHGIGVLRRTPGSCPTGSVLAQ